jgi:hypothetical protein
MTGDLLSFHGDVRGSSMFQTVPGSVRCLTQKGGKGLRA